jgi:hypothetical protein
MKKKESRSAKSTAKSVKPRGRVPSTSRPRPKLIKVSDEMRRFSTLLLEEVQTWPEVTTRPMFGFIGVYRGRKIFAALPRTRAMDAANSFILKLHAPPAGLQKSARRAVKDERIRLGEGKKGWSWYFVNSERDIHGALEWLNHAWRLA